MGARDRPWNRARTNEEFLSELYEFRQDVEPLDLYPGSRVKKMHFKCLNCGNIFETTPVLILKGRKCENCKPRTIKYDLTGKKFGMLTVIGVDKGKNDFNKIYWNCVCDCGNYVSASTSSLKDGSTASCGCKRAITLRNKTKKYNEYSMCEDYVIGYTTNTNKEFKIDKEDFEKIKNNAWRESPYGYIISSCKSQNIYMHRIIMDCPDNYEVDHINHNKMDNRKSNLRVCSHQQNNYNKVISKYNTSGHTGVQWEKRFNRWRSRISVNGKDIHLGLFKEYEDAVKAREEAEIKYYKEFRYKGDN